MKIAIFGATGNSGLELIKQGLERGHEITAIVRNPAKLAQFKDNDKFKVVTGNIFDSKSLVDNLKGQDAVLSGLGAPGIHIFQISLYIDSMKAITAAMNEANVKRLICITAFYTKPNDGTYPGIYTFLLRPMIGRQLDNMYVMEEFLKTESKDIDFTIVRPPRLTDQPMSATGVIVKEEVYHFTDVKSKNETPRANVAKFILDTLENNGFIRKAVAIDMPFPEPTNK